jgi:transcriptional regulator of acetoin/glycerol metabolism
MVSAGGLKASQKELGIEPCRALQKLKAQGMYGVYLMREADLETLRRAEAQFVDRKTKNEHKELSKVLLGHVRIPIVSGGYSTSGRLRQGLEALLKKAALADDRNLYIIGTNERLFDELWHNGERRAVAGLSTLKGSKSRSAKPANQFKDEAQSSSLLLELLAPGDVPHELMMSYFGESVEVQLVRELILRAAKVDVPVLILGDTGTGKEIVARAVHQHSARREYQFVPVNCGAIPRELFETELFGAVGGVATGVRDRAGLWELTGRGTLFLDEIGDLPPEHQVKILRALQESKVRRVGESREKTVAARIIAATNRNLFQMVQAGRFREDLYYRLCSFLIQTPALKEHPQDIPQLAQFLWKGITGEPSQSLSKEILARLKSYRWPGNVRELKAVLSNIYTLFGKDNLGVEHLDAVYQEPKAAPDAQLFQRGDEERLKNIARNYETHDIKQENRLLGTWKGTGEDLIVPGHLELEQTHTYTMKLTLRREEGRIKGRLSVYVKERRDGREARMELISISGDYFTFQYLLTTSNASHYGVMMFHLLGVGDRMKGFFLTKKIFEAKIGIGAVCFQKT